MSQARVLKSIRAERQALSKVPLGTFQIHAKMWKHVTWLDLDRLGHYLKPGELLQQRR